MNDNYQNKEYQEPDYYAMYTEEKLKEARSTFSRFHLALFLYTASAYAAVIIAEIIMIAVMGLNEAAALIENNVYVNALFSFLPMYLVGFPIFFFVMRGMKTMKREKTKMPVSEFLSLFLISQVAMIVGSIIGETLNGFIGVFKGESVTNQTDELISVMPTWLIFAVVVIIAPIIEELIFRKFMIDRFSRYGDSIAITVSAISFGLFHGNFYQFFYAAMLGFILGYMYSKTRNVIYPILLHMIINFTGSILSLLVSERLVEFETMLTDLAEGIQVDMARFLQNMMIVGSYSIIQYALIGGGIVMLVTFIRKRKYKIKQSWEYKIPGEQIASTVFCNTGTIMYLVLSAILFTVSILV